MEGDPRPEPIRQPPLPEPPASAGEARNGSLVKKGMILSMVLGVTALTGLLAYYGFASIGLAVLAAGWGLIVVILFHGVQMVFSSLAWRALIPPGEPRSFSLFFWLRWIREAVNALLPVAQIGGEVIAARLMAFRGIRIGTAAASVTVDLTMEMVTQILFTLAGLGLLVMAPHDAAVTGWVVGGLVTAVLAAAGFIIAQRLGLLKLVEALLEKMSEKWGWMMLGSVTGLHDAIQRMYGDHRALLAACLHHGISWALGAIEVCLALYYLGHPVGLREGLIIESLGQALKAAGFAVPGALAIQEGGYIIVCGLFGIGPETAIALSLVKRLREVVLGVPGLLAWQWVEGRRVIARMGAEPAAEQPEP